jgi:alanine racemase
MNNLMWLEINLRSLKKNIKNIKMLLDTRTKFMAVVKSNAYGHGIFECAKAAIEAGADWLGVINIEEALSLRNLGFRNPILVLGYVMPRDMEKAVVYDISVSLTNWEQLSKISAIQFPISKKLKVHLKIETGVSRLGYTQENWDRLIESLNNLPKNIMIEGIYSHFASVEEYDLTYSKKQMERFLDFKDLFQDNYKLPIGMPQPLYHMAASAPTLIMPESHFDMVRSGIAIYGLWPSLKIRDSFEAIRSKLKLKIKGDFLEPILSYKARIVQMKDVKVGDYIGYGCTYPVDKPMVIAIIPVGYAEGYDRGLSNPALPGHKSGTVLIKNQKCPIVGRICMNMSMVDISVFASLEDRPKIGDEVTLIGNDRNDIISVDEIAEKIGTINYEVVTRLPGHLPRKYIK